MKIEKLVCAPGRTGFYFDDQQAIKAGARSDGMFYLGQAQTPGFQRIRQPGESISWADCAAVQYSGAGGRDPLFLASDFTPFIME